MASLDNPASTRLQSVLAKVAPGTPLRDGIERILRGGNGALIVLGKDALVEKISTGGFLLDVPFTPTGLRELAKMDGAIILDSTLSRIHRANVHLMPDHTIHSDETGSRHRTADRVAQQTGFPVISVSESMETIAIYIDAMRHVLESSTQILPRANQAIATLERYKVRLDEVSHILSALEIEDQVTVRDVAIVAQRLEMVNRIVAEVEAYILELGTDGRLLSLQLQELIAGLDTELELVIQDYLPSRKRSLTPAKVTSRLAQLPQPQLVDITQVAETLGFSAADALDAPVSPGGYRMLSRIPRLPRLVIERLVTHFGGLQQIMSATVDDLQAVEGVGDQRARNIREGLSRLAESSLVDRLI